LSEQLKLDNMTQMTTEDRLAADKWLDQLDTDAALKGDAR